MKCDVCGLYNTAIVNNLRGIQVGKNPKLMIVNSTVNLDDVRNGVLRVPPILEHYLYENGIKEYYYTLQVKCDVVKHKSKTIGKDYLTSCDDRLLHEIHRIKPTHILAIGKEAIWMNTGKNKTKTMEFIPTITDRGVVYSVSTLQEHKLSYGVKQIKKLLDGKKLNNYVQNITIIKTKNQLNEAINTLKTSQSRMISYDIESQGLDRYKDKIVAFGFGDSYSQFIIPLDIRFSPLKGKWKLQKLLVRDAVMQLNLLCRLHKDKMLTAGNGKFDNLFLQHQYGVKPNLEVDVVLDAHCFDETTPNDVKSNAMRFLDVADWDVPLEIKTGKAIETPKDYKKFITYLGYDILYEAELGEYFFSKIERDKRVRKLVNHIYMKSSPSYEIIENNGVSIDAQRFDEESKKLLDKQDELTEQLNTMLGREVKWGSTAELQKVMFDDLGLPILKRTPAGAPSTDVLVLKQLHLMHPDNDILDTFMELRSTSTLINFFINGWKDKLISESRNTYKLHPTFLVHGTRTGRTSSQNPNLQQLTKNKDLRSLVYAPPGWVFLESDYSQLELRVAAYLSREPSMLDAYMHNKDIHKITYESIFGPLSDDKNERYKQRTNAKAINFGFVFGMHAPTYITTALKGYDVLVSLPEAQRQRTKYFETYPGLLEWHERARTEGAKKGYIESPLGRRRLLPDINSPNKWARLEDERRAINSPVQGLGNDFMLCALSEITGQAKYVNKKTRLDLTRFKPIGTVHDALLALVREDYAYEAAMNVKSIMEDPLVLRKVFNFQMDIPLVADVTIGRGWGIGEEIDFSKRPRKQINDIIRKIA